MNTFLVKVVCILFLAAITVLYPFILLELAEEIAKGSKKK